MGSCSAVGCNNTARKGFTMNRFPDDKDLRQQWLVNMKRAGWQPTPRSCLCEVHFEASMWNGTHDDGTKRLNTDAIPTLFAAIRPKKRKKTSKNNSDADSDDSSFSSPNSSSTSGSNSSDSEGLRPVPVRKRLTRARKPTPVNSQPPAPPSVQKVFNPYSQNKQSAAHPPPKPQPAYILPKPQNNVFVNNYPICQDVKFSKLPFYDVLAELLKPSSLIPSQPAQKMQEKIFYFYLTPQQTSDIVSSRTVKMGYVCEFEKQVQLRFCLAETICEQEDYFPPNIAVKVNNKVCGLPTPVQSSKPNVEPKRPSRPINITPLIKMSYTVPNSVTVIWTPDFGPGFTVSISLVQKLSAGDLVERLKKKGAMHADQTRSLIKEKLNEDMDSEIMTTSLRVSLLCPLGRMRMSSPCRATTCQHLQCFDASTYLHMNEKKPTWNCPVCDKPALFDNLVVDGYFKEVIASTRLPVDVNEIQLNKDGTWCIHTNERVSVISCPTESIEIIADDGDTPVRRNEARPIEVVDLVISDSEEEVQESAPSQQLTAGKFGQGIPSKQNETVINLDSSTSVSSSSYAGSDPEEEAKPSGPSEVQPAKTEPSQSVSNHDAIKEHQTAPMATNDDASSSSCGSRQPQKLNNICSGDDDIDRLYITLMDDDAAPSSEALPSTINTNDLAPSFTPNFPTAPQESESEISSSNIDIYVGNL